MHCFFVDIVLFFETVRLKIFPLISHGGFVLTAFYMLRAKILTRADYISFSYIMVKIELSIAFSTLIIPLN